MTDNKNLRDKTLLITGASRGIGLAIGVRAAQDGARVIVVAKTVEPHPKLPGTIHTAVAAIEAAGGQGLACPADIRSEEQVEEAVARGVDRFGQIDIQQPQFLLDVVQRQVRQVVLLWACARDCTRSDDPKRRLSSGIYDMSRQKSSGGA